MLMIIEKCYSTRLKNAGLLPEGGSEVVKSSADPSDTPDSVQPEGDYDKVSKDVSHNFQQLGILSQVILRSKSEVQEVVAYINVLESGLSEENNKYLLFHERMVLKHIRKPIDRYDDLIGSRRKRSGIVHECRRVRC